MHFDILSNYAGAQVIIAVRDTTRGRQAAEDIYKKTGKSVHIKRLDLACLENVRDFAEDLRKDYDRLDILINNAGSVHIYVNLRNYHNFSNFFLGFPCEIILSQYFHYIFV